jgi:hypothetical protein
MRRRLLPEARQFQREAVVLKAFIDPPPVDEVETCDGMDADRLSSSMAKVSAVETHTCWPPSSQQFESHQRRVGEEN